MPGNKTHEQQLRAFERKDDAPKVGEPPTHLSNEEIAARSRHSSATPPSRDQEGYSTGHSGGNVESRDHNKHNHEGQPGHKPQHHTRAEEKH